MPFPGPSTKADEATPETEREAATPSSDDVLDDDLRDGDDAGEDRELSAIDGVLARVSERLEDDRRRRREDDHEALPGAGDGDPAAESSAPTAERDSAPPPHTENDDEC